MSDLLTELMQIKQSEREGLTKLPLEVAIRAQSGWLLGYADCWNKVYLMLKKMRLIKNKGAGN